MSLLLVSAELEASLFGPGIRSLGSVAHRSTAA